MLQRRRSACGFFQCRTRVIQLSLRLTQTRLIFGLSLLTGHELSFEFLDILLPIFCLSNRRILHPYSSKREGDLDNVSALHEWKLLRPAVLNTDFVHHLFLS